MMGFDFTDTAAEMRIEAESLGDTAENAPVFPFYVEVEVDGETHRSNTLREPIDIRRLEAEAEYYAKRAKIASALVDRVHEMFSEE